MKMHFPKMKPTVSMYDKYKTFNNDVINLGADPREVDGVASHPPLQMKKKERKWVFLKLYLKLMTASN